MPIWNLFTTLNITKKNTKGAHKKMVDLIFSFQPLLIIKRQAKSKKINKISKGILIAAFTI